MDDPKEAFVAGYLSALNEVFSFKDVSYAGPKAQREWAETAFRECSDIEGAQDE